MTGASRTGQKFFPQSWAEFAIFEKSRSAKRAWHPCGKKDQAMKTWLSLATALGAVLLVVTFSFGAGLEIQGNIGNWKEVKAKVPADAYLQLVKYDDKMKGNTDEEGFSAFDSKLAKIKVRDNGSFKLTVKELPPGKYFIALQRALPKEMTGESQISAVPILVTDKGQALVLEVPGDFPVNVGKVFVAVRSEKKPEPKEAPKKESPKKPEPSDDK
jgi:hypothetical protein